MKQTKVKGETASVVELIVGGLLVIGGFGSFGAGSNFAYSIAFVLFGLFFIVNAIEWRLLISNFKRYMPLLKDDKEKSILNLAKATSSSEMIVKKNLMLMIKKRMLKGAAINDQTGVIVLGSNEPNTPNPSSAVTSESISKEPEIVTMSCPNCGASNKLLEGAASECEHCGAPINTQ